MVHFKTIFKRETSASKKVCKFSLHLSASKVVKGMYDRETDKFYALGKDDDPEMHVPYSNPRAFAVAYGCNAGSFSEQLYLNDRTLHVLHIEGMIFSS